MATPEFILRLREKIGHDLLWLIGVTAYVEDPEGRVLLGRRADSGEWALVYGINGPIAYDRACPVEVDRDVVLYFDSDNFEAYCPKCGSRFNVCDAGGVPVSGEAVDRKYGLQQFRVIATNGGYVITR